MGSHDKDSLSCEPTEQRRKPETLYAQRGLSNLSECEAVTANQLALLGSRLSTQSNGNTKLTVFLCLIDGTVHTVESDKVHVFFISVHS